MARDVKHLRGPGLAHQCEAGGRTTRARRIEEDSRLLRGKTSQKPRQPVFDAPKQKLAVASLTAGGVAARRLHGWGVQFNSREPLDEIGHFHAEKPHAAIG